MGIKNYVPGELLLCQEFLPGFKLERVMEHYNLILSEVRLDNIVCPGVEISQELECVRCAAFSQLRINKRISLLNTHY